MVIGRELDLYKIGLKMNAMEERRHLFFLPRRDVLDVLRKIQISSERRYC